jgi:hypothetical protein
MAKLPGTPQRRRETDLDRAARLLEEEGATTRASMLRDWHEARDARVPDPEPPWWVTEALRTPILPEPEIVPEPTIGDGGGYYGYYEDEEAESAAASEIAEGHRQSEEGETP